MDVCTRELISAPRVVTERFDVHLFVNMFCHPDLLILAGKALGSLTLSESVSCDAFGAMRRGDGGRGGRLRVTNEAVASAVRMNTQQSKDDLKWRRSSLPQRQDSASSYVPTFNPRED